MPAKDRLIVALDVPSADQARALIETLGDSVGVYKIGLELLFCGGFALAEELASDGRAVFIDAKLADIETTVERATRAIAGLGARFLTIHALDAKTLAAAVRGRGDSSLKLLGVTVLTNLAPSDLVEQGVERPLEVGEPDRVGFENGFEFGIFHDHAYRSFTASRTRSIVSMAIARAFRDPSCRMSRTVDGFASTSARRARMGSR